MKIRVVFAHPQHGGAAVEYLIVTIFSLVLTAAGIGMVVKTIKQKINDIESATDIDLDQDWLDRWEWDK